MSLSLLLKRGGKFLSKTYVKPWHDKTRAVLMIAMLPGLFCSGVQGLALAYHMAGFGPLTATLFHVGRMAVLGLCIIPGCYWLLSLRHGRLFLLLLQAIGTVLFLFDPQASLLNGLAYALTAGPFWALYSQRNAAALSQDNHGNETALLLYLQTIVISLGIFIGGLLLDLNLYFAAMVGGSLGQMLSVALTAQKLPRQDRIKGALNLIGWKRPACRLSFFVATLFAMFDNGLPTWMRLVGLSPLSTGASLALRPILGLILTPIAGNLIQKGGLAPGRVGGLTLVAGWGFIGFAVFEPWLLLPAIAFLTIGIGLISPMEVNRWFKRRQTSAIIAREIVLASGRVSSLSIFIPLIFLVPASLPLLGLAGGLAFAWGSRARKKISIQNAVDWPASNRSQ